MLYILVRWAIRGMQCYYYGIFYTRRRQMSFDCSYQWLLKFKVIYSKLAFASKIKPMSYQMPVVWLCQCGLCVYLNFGNKTANIK